MKIVLFYRYKTANDPTVDDVRRLCQSLRRNAKEERILFHYNGHGVPRPTENGEIWVFNKNFTQVSEIFRIYSKIFSLSRLLTNVFLILGISFSTSRFRFLTYNRGWVIRLCTSGIVIVLV